jgi:hypothetical protein
MVEVQVIGATYRFGRPMIEVKRDEIKALLSELDPKFFRSVGGGGSVIDMPVDRYNRQWGEQIDADALCALAFAAGLGEYCMPREVWSVLPGGMPYVVFDINLRDHALAARIQRKETP